MGRVNGINQYKHGITRTYLYLDDAGRCYLKAEKGGYVPGNWGVELGKMEAWRGWRGCISTGRQTVPFTWVSRAGLCSAARWGF